MNSGVLSERGFSGITTLYLLPVPHHLRPLHGHNIGFSLFSQHILPFHGFLPALVQRGLQPRHLLISACRNLTIPQISAHMSRLQLKENTRLSCTPPPPRFFVTHVSLAMLSHPLDSTVPICLCLSAPVHREHITGRLCGVSLYPQCPCCFLHE